MKINGSKSIHFNFAWKNNDFWLHSIRLMIDNYMQATYAKPYCTPWIGSDINMNCIVLSILEKQTDLNWKYATEIRRVHTKISNKINTKFNYFLPFF